MRYRSACTTSSNNACKRTHKLDQPPNNFSSPTSGSRKVTWEHCRTTRRNTPLKLTIRDSSTMPSRPSSRAFLSSHPRPGNWARPSSNLISIVMDRSIMMSFASHSWSKTCRACHTSKTSERSSIRLIRIILAQSSTLSSFRYP